MDTRTSVFLQETAEVLEHNILDFWLGLRDPRGGFYGEVAASGEILDDAPRGIILNARIIWAFSAAYGALGKPGYLSAAKYACDWFMQHFVDAENGGVYWSVTAEGERLDDKKQLYAQGFAIYGLSELYKVTRDMKVLAAAASLFRVVEDHFADRENGGYIEALARDFSPLEDMSLSAHDINADKTMNSHLHLLEAYANLYRVWPDAELGKALVSLLDLTCTRIMAPDGHLQLYFRRDWSVLPGAVSYGHDIETSWLMLECAFATRDIDVVSRVRPFALSMGRAGNEGLLPDPPVVGSGRDSRGQSLALEVSLRPRRCRPCHGCVEIHPRQAGRPRGWGVALGHPSRRLAGCIPAQGRFLEVPLPQFPNVSGNIEII